MAEMMRPDERVLRADIAAGPFESGVERGRWRLIAIEWPHVVIAVSAASRKQGPAEYCFCFECSNYPQVPPNAQLWDPKQKAPLAVAEWPGGGERVTLAFRPDWQGGRAIYLPCDRVSIQGHDGWRTQHPHLIWTTTSDITLYLETLYDLLHSTAYTGPRGA